MQCVPIEAEAKTKRRGLTGDALLALALALLLSAAWAVHDWEHLRRLILPDADDMMRLAQVRDWLAGQATNDWTQYRMAPPLGAPMHWSRVNDAGIAALILAGTPVLGRHGAEIVAVLAYPAFMLATCMFLSARIGRRLWGADAAFVSIVLAGLAYPGTTVLIPGRIDHHGLQDVLALGAALVSMRRPNALSGALAGVMVAISLVIGLELTIQLAALTGVILIRWVVRGGAELGRLAGYGVALAVTTLPFVLFLRPTYWSAAVCDAFTPATSTGTLVGAAALTLLAALTPVLRDWRWRLGVAAVLGGAVLTTLVALYPACVAGPYGQVDPFLRREFITHIDEANGIFAQTSFGRAIQLTGLVVIGTAGAAWLIWRQPNRWPVWAPIVALLFVSAALVLVQVRGAYLGAPATAPILAGVILTARRRPGRTTGPVILAWLACSGMAWAQVPPAIGAAVLHVAHPERKYKAGMTFQMMCNSGDTWTLVDRYPAGIILAPTNMASYLIGATRMSTVGAGYHRNNRGNMAMYRYFLSTPDDGRSIADQWHARYVAFCPGDFSEMDVVTRFPHSLATRLTYDNPPPWLQRLPLPRSHLRLYRIVR